METAVSGLNFAFVLDWANVHIRFETERSSRGFGSALAGRLKRSENNKISIWLGGFGRVTLIESPGKETDRVATKTTQTVWLSIYCLLNCCGWVSALCHYLVWSCLFLLAGFCWLVGFVWPLLENSTVCFLVNANAFLHFYFDPVPHWLGFSGFWGLWIPLITNNLTSFWFFVSCWIFCWRFGGLPFFSFLLGVVCFADIFLTESLILAQDERWRRA